MRIRISWDDGAVEAVLDATPTAQKVWAALEPDARQVVEKGAVCFWAEGQALALPYGPTPISAGDECRLVSKVNVLGHIEGDPRALAGVCAGTLIWVARVE